MFEYLGTIVSTLEVIDGKTTAYQQIYDAAGKLMCECVVVPSYPSIRTHPERFRIIHQRRREALEQRKRRHR